MLFMSIDNLRYIGLVTLSAGKVISGKFVGVRDI